MAKVVLTKTEEKLLANALKAVQANYDFKRKLKNEVRMQNARRARVGDKFRQGLMQAAFKAANIDQSTIARRKELDNRSVRETLARLIPTLNDHAALVKQSHADRISMLKELGKGNLTPRMMPGPQPPPNPPGPPPPAKQIAILTKADSITVTSGAVATNRAPWNNTVQVKLEAPLPNVPDSSAFDWRCDVMFTYTPPRDGMLHAWIWVAPNGSATATTDGHCDAFDWAAARASASVVVQQPLAKITNQIKIPEQLLGPVLDLSHTYPGCSSDSGVQVYDDFLTFENAGMELGVTAKKQVQIIVSIFLDGITINGTCALDFQTGVRQINIPAVVLNLF